MTVAPPGFVHQKSSDIVRCPVSLRGAKSSPFESHCSIPPLKRSRVYMIFKWGSLPTCHPEGLGTHGLLFAELRLVPGDLGIGQHVLAFRCDLFNYNKILSSCHFAQWAGSVKMRLSVSCLHQNKLSSPSPCEGAVRHDCSTRMWNPRQFVYKLQLHFAGPKER